MNNSILLSLSAKNFASFADGISFTTEANISKKEHLHNTFNYGDFTINKVSFIYGANGSGKTFFCKIIREIQRLLIWSPLTIINEQQKLALPNLKALSSPVTNFAFDTKYKNAPTVFSIDILLHGVTYHYEFSIHDEKIIYELLTKKYRRTEKLLERTSPNNKDIKLRSELKDFESKKTAVKEEALCLPIAGILNNVLAQKIVDAITDIQVVNMTAAKLQPTQSKASFSDLRIAKYISILKKADPTLRDMKVSYEEEEIARQKIDVDDFENREIISKKTTVGIETHHAVFDDGEETTSIPISFFADESLGTVKLFTVLPYLYDILESGGVLVIDEIENGLHLSLAKEIVNLFIDESTNPNNAQLICTSHQPLLVDGNYRRDQVWVTSKDERGKCLLYRMSDMKTPHAKVNLSNKILEGAFGCNPERFFNNNI